MEGDGPGLVGRWAESRDIHIKKVELFSGCPLPEPSDGDMILIMGGSMGVYDEERCSWLTAEKAYLKTQIGRGIPCFGICLGAQLLAECLGGRVTKNGIAEIGYFPVEFHPEAMTGPLLSGLDRTIVPLHWHHDTFEIPEGAVPLGSSEACRRQGFLSEDRNILGFQFHIEADELLGASWTDEEPDEVAHAGLPPEGRYIQSKEEMREMGARHTAGNREFLFTVLDRFWDCRNR